MKPEIHPEYREVVFMDASVTPPFKVLTRSTRASEETVEWEDGNTYPLVRVEISSASHPFYTGKMKLVDSAGMVDRFRRRYGLTDAEGQEGEAPDASSAEELETPQAETPSEGSEENPSTDARAESPVDA